MEKLDIVLHLMFIHLEFVSSFYLINKSNKNLLGKVQVLS
jgi:hypothetical protein